jgi:alpha-tubulin suppressor-like RCC1 family protein
MFGRSAFSALGVPEDAISENTPRRVLATDFGAEEGVGFVYAACGRSHSLLVGSDGQVWSAGANNLGQVSCVFWLVAFGCALLTALVRQCGHSVAPQIPTFRAIDGPFVDGERQRVIKAAAGVTFSVVLTEDGKGAYASTYSIPSTL